MCVCMCLVVRGCGGGAVNVVVGRAVEGGTCRRACAAQTLGWLATSAVGRAFLVEVLAGDRAPLVDQANDTRRSFSRCDEMANATLP